MRKNIKEIVRDASIAFIGSPISIEMQKDIEKGGKFKYIIHGFSENWTCIQVQWQKDGATWRHETIKKWNNII